MFSAVLIGIVAGMTIIALSRNASAQPQIACDESMCFVPRAMLVELAEQADAAESYGAMCNWPGFKK